MAFPDGTIDFRSDTVTRPTDEMRRAMADAVVGDDVYGEDPTVNELEERAAALVGKEAAVLVPSGTMANAIAINISTSPGEEVLTTEWAHIRNYEQGAAQALSGVAFRNVPGRGGVIDPDEVAAYAGDADDHLARVSLLVWENTHNVMGGVVVAQDVVVDSSSIARRSGMRVHLDGARLFNAVAASGRTASELAEPADTVMFSLSKGLGAPVGSLLCGSVDDMARARRVRKRLGGGMRQAGIIAAPGLIALRDRERLTEDHALASRLADVVAEAFEGAVLAAPQTNMVVVDESATGPPGALLTALASEGIKAGYSRPGVLRFVTHRDVDDADVERTAKVVAKIS